MTTLSRYRDPHAARQMSDSAMRWGELASPRGWSGLARASDLRSRLRKSATRPLGQAVALAIAYYVGARVGFAFKLPGAPQSVLWLPNSILLATALMTRAREWPLYFALAFPAQLLVGLQNHAPIGAMSLLYLTNCMDAALGATAVRLASRGKWRLDSLNNLILFLAIGATIGPVFVSFLDAAVTVLTGWAPSYWTAYTTRLRANLLTNVILVPTIVGALGAGIGEWRHRLGRRFLEGIILIGLLLMASAFVFSRPFHANVAALFYLPLPFLLWAAVRFGPSTTGTALLALAFVSSWSAVRGQGAFSGVSPSSTITALQVFLLFMSIPLLCLAMVIKERESAARELRASRHAVRVGVDTVRDLAGRLIAAQEDERSRVARELHDNVGQFVAEVALTMSTMRRAPAVQNAGLDADFQRLYEQTGMLFETIRAVSHELHPSVLRHAGLVSALESLCAGFGRLQVAVEFIFEPIDAVPDNVSLCLYRVAQEALHNVATHSGARHARVTLSRRADEISLSIEDDGSGFDTVLAHVRGGLGLVSMEERVRLAQGRFNVESGATGTRITARIPLGTTTAT